MPKAQQYTYTIEVGSGIKMEYWNTFNQTGETGTATREFYQMSFVPNIQVSLVKGQYSFTMPSFDVSVSISNPVVYKEYV